MLLSAGVAVCAQTAPADIRSLAERAYIYAYPMVLMEETRAGAQINQLNHFQAFPEPQFRQVVRPNADTLYSTAWIDLSREPVIIKVPDSGGRYYFMQFMDDWTETLSVPGKRTTGTSEQWLVLVGPGWKGTLPERAMRIDAPTNIVWLIGRTQTNGTADYENVHEFQRGMRMMRLSAYPDGVERRTQAAGLGPEREGQTPPQRVRAMDATTFFTKFAVALRSNPPHAADGDIVRDLAKIGIVPGEDFDASKLDGEGLRAFEDGVRAASSRLETAPTALAGFGAGPTGWSKPNPNVGRYGTNYAARAAIARIGLGANPPEDAVYLNAQADRSGEGFNGAHRYRMHFEKGSLPPVRAFWSVSSRCAEH